MAARAHQQSTLPELKLCNNVTHEQCSGLFIKRTNNLNASSNNVKYANIGKVLDCHIQLRLLFLEVNSMVQNRWKKTHSVALNFEFLTLEF